MPHGPGGLHVAGTPQCHVTGEGGLDACSLAPSSPFPRLEISAVNKAPGSLFVSPVCESLRGRYREDPSLLSIAKAIWLQGREGVGAGTGLGPHIDTVGWVGERLEVGCR